MDDPSMHSLSNQNHKDPTHTHSPPNPITELSNPLSVCAYVQTMALRRSLTQRNLFHEPPAAAPDKVHALLCTGNLGNAAPTPESFQAWIPHRGSIEEVTRANAPFENCKEQEEHEEKRVLQRPDSFDLIVVGMQEATWASGRNGSSLFRKRFSSGIRESALNDDSAAGSGGEEKGMTVSDMEVLNQKSNVTLSKLFQKQLPNYKCLVERQRGQMRLYVFVRSDVCKYVSDITWGAENTGVGGIGSNKGGIMAALTIHDTRVSFLTAHLAAHEGEAKYNARCANVREILNSVRLEKAKHLREYDPTMVSHYCFAMGDLNFRTNFDDEILKDSHIENSTSEGESEIESQSTVQKRRFRYQSSMADDDIMKQRNLAMGHKLAANKDWETLYAADELMKGIRQGEVFHGFVTPRCNFNPTFKVTKDMREYKYNPKRTPSYTDRILYKTCDGYESRISTDAYHPCADFITSDHKPIRGVFSFTTVASTKSADVDLKTDNFLSFATMRKMRGSQPTKQYFIISLTKMRCSNLPVMDTGPNAKADPYIKLVVNNEKLLKKIDMKGLLCKKISWPKSAVLEYTLDPVWKDDEVVDITLKFDHPRKLIGSILFITVMDWDLASEDDLIGTLQLDLMTLYEKYTKGIKSIDINGPVVKCAKTGRGNLACTLKMEIK